MPEQPVNDEQADIKKRAMQRLAVAASLIAAAVVTLTALNYKKPEQPQPVSTSSAPVMEQAAPVLPESEAEKPLEEEKPAQPPVEPSAEQTPPVPDTAAIPATHPAPPPPQVINKAESPTAAKAKPRAEAPAAFPIVRQASPEALKPAKSTTPAAAPQQPAPAASAATEQKAITVPHQPAKPATEPSPPKAYVVQLGLFTNPDNALQLQKRLAEHGIKSYTETRLQVGPFQTKAEADQAQAKIRSLGINAVLAPVR